MKCRGVLSLTAVLLVVSISLAGGQTYRRSNPGSRSFGSSGSSSSSSSSGGVSSLGRRLGSSSSSSSSISGRSSSSIGSRSGSSSSSSSSSSRNYDYKGTYIGSIKTLEHKVSGEVYALNDTAVYIEGFTYDGEAPDAFFFAGKNTETPSHRGFIIPDEKGTKHVLGPYARKNIILHFPVTKKGQRTVSEVKWISVWCRQFAIDFGHVLIPADLKIPKKEKATGLSSDKPLVSSEAVTILDTNTVQVNDFTFDGTVPDAIFVMGSGDANKSGVQLANERGEMTPLNKYTRESINLEIPAELRGKPLQYFGVWSPTKGMLASVTFDPEAALPPGDSV